MERDQQKHDLSRQKMTINIAFKYLKKKIDWKPNDKKRVTQGRSAREETLTSKNFNCKT